MSNLDSMKDADASVEVSRQPKSAQQPLDAAMGAGLFWFGGLIAAAGGALCAFGPQLLPAQAQLFAQVAARGITPGVLWCAAALMCSLALLARALGRNLQVLNKEDDQSMLIEQVAMDLAQTRSSMQELRVEFVYLKDHVTNMGRDLPTQIASANESTTRDAMYRLAASLDQVGARLEQRIRSQHGTLEGTLQEVQQSLQSTCEQILQLQESFSQLPGPGSSAALGMPAVPGTWEQPPEPVAPISLGVLDHLADDRASANDESEQIELGAPLPADQPSYEEKLIQLTQLLADPRVRAAADGLSRSRGL